MNRFLLILISCLCLTTTISAQSNKLIKELESKRGALQQQIAETESLLKKIGRASCRERVSSPV